MITKISYFYEHYNGLLLHFISNFFLLLACFPLGIVYTPVKKLILLILTHNKKLCRKHVDPGIKNPKWLKLSPNKRIGSIM